MSDFPFHNISKKEMYDAMKLNLVTPHLYSKNNDFFVDIDPDTNMNTTSIKKQCANYNHLKFNNSFTEQKYIYFYTLTLGARKKILTTFFVVLIICILNLHLLSYQRYGEIVIPLHSIILRDTLISMKQEIRK